MVPPVGLGCSLPRRAFPLRSRLPFAWAADPRQLQRRATRRRRRLPPIPPWEVSPITIDLGADAIDVIGDQCNFDPSCIAQSGVKQHVSANLDHILGALRSAAPDTEIIVVVLYNPFKPTNPASDELWNQYYVQVASEAAARAGANSSPEGC